MKKLLMTIAACCTMLSCGHPGQTGGTAAQTQAKDRVEVIYFHSKQRCKTCMAIEKLTEELLQKQYARQMADSTLVYRNIDISQPEGEAVADKYEVTWSSLVVTRHRNGQETAENMTEQAFATALGNPEAFTQQLASQIDSFLKQ